MTIEDSKVSKVLDLLKQGSPDTFQQRFRSAERLMFDEGGDDTAFLCRLLARAIASDEEFPNADTLLERAVCSVSENELRLLADMILESGKHIEDLYGLPAVVASQIPEAFPIEVLMQLYDYRGWFQSTNPLAIQTAWHLVFADPLTFAADIPNHGEHPTWRLPATGETFLVGGKSSAHCTSCGHPRVHLVTLSPVPEGLGLSLNKLTLETCANCSGQIFFSHSPNGTLEQVGPPPDPGLDFCEIYPLPVRARFAPTPQRWTRQSWASGRQNLFRFGGLPAWVQYPEIPVVPETNRSMRFLAQFDSFLGAEGGETFLWGSGGMLYVFWDEETRTSCTFAQWT